MGVDYSVNSSCADMTVMVTKMVQEQGKKKVRIFLNDEFAFSLYRSEIRKLNLEEGMALSDEQYQQINEEILFKRATARAMHLLEKIDRTEFEVRKKLKENEYTPEAIDVAVEYVKKFHYLDDERYVNDYIRFKSIKSSKNKIIQELLQKGIKKDLIMACMEESTIDESALIEKWIRKKYPVMRELDRSEKQKLFASLYRKGFSIGKIEKAYSDILLDIT